MKTIKIGFEGFWKNFDPEKLFITKILRKHYNVELSEEADYVICSGFGFYNYLDEPGIRIMFSGENYIPDFNYIDYALSFYPIEFLDRHCSIPGLVPISVDALEELGRKNRDYGNDILKEKVYFANLLAGHESDENMRSRLLDVLSQYKRVECAGTFRNNMPGGQTVSIAEGTKLPFVRKCKFTLCPESVVHEGFVTEKIFDAFQADTIPIYYGSSTVSSIFNAKAYLDVRDFENLDALLERIIELDNDDEKYLEMLRQPIFTNSCYVEESLSKMEAFLCSIFDQPKEKAYRRCHLYMPAEYERTLAECRRRGFGYLVGKYYGIKDKINEIMGKESEKRGDCSLYGVPFSSDAIKRNKRT